ncbi:hypothetical protein B0H11DRAFT_1901469 [Mycena galericulata]|nr:hypothetical protein B0H11DRAFT_1901469 [Mycena galericulata]
MGAGSDVESKQISRNNPYVAVSHVWAEKYFYFKIISYYNTRKPKADSKTEGSKTHKPKKDESHTSQQNASKKAVTKAKICKRRKCASSVGGRWRQIRCDRGGNVTKSAANCRHIWRQSPFGGVSWRHFAAVAALSPCPLAIATRFSDSKAVSVKIGNSIKLYAVSAQMPDILNDVLKIVNPQIIDNKLGERPVEISSTGTLANFYAVHTSTKSKAATYIENVPTQFSKLARGGKEKLVCLEFVINVDLYRDRVDREREMSPAVTGSTVRKRTASSASGSDALPKRMRPSVPSGLLTA